MKYLNSYNEGLFDIFRKKKNFDKDDLYIFKTKLGEKKIGPSELNDDNTFYSLYFPETDLSFIKKHIVESRWQLRSKGVFGNFGAWSWEPYGFNSIDSVGSTSVWYDIGDLFVNLRKISSELGYELNQDVHVISKNVDSKIVDIINVSFYNMVDGISKYIDSCYTLLYKVEGDDAYYQIGQLEKIDIIRDNNIVDDIIKENFLELIDEGLIEFISEEFTNRGRISYNCLVKVSKDINPEILFKISECLLVASKRLNDEGIFINIDSMKHEPSSSTTNITFTAIKK